MYPKVSSACDDRIRSALRQIIRAIDVYSRKLNTEFGLTTPQLWCMHALAQREKQTLSELAKALNLCVSTVNGIVDRLEVKQYVLRNRSTIDRRRVFIDITSAGLAIVQNAPPLLQDKFSAALADLTESDQVALTTALEKIVGLMGTGGGACTTLDATSTVAVPK